jgi:hypothetical protein
MFHRIASLLFGSPASDPSHELIVCRPAAATAIAKTSRAQRTRRPVRFSTICRNSTPAPFILITPIRITVAGERLPSTFAPARRRRGRVVGHHTLPGQPALFFTHGINRGGKPAARFPRAVKQRPAGHARFWNHLGRCGLAKLLSRATWRLCVKDRQRDAPASFLFRLHTHGPTRRLRQLRRTFARRLRPRSSSDHAVSLRCLLRPQQYNPVARRLRA